MSPDETDLPEQQFADQLIACEEAIASGEEPSLILESAASAELQARLAKTLETLKQLEQVRARRRRSRLREQKRSGESLGGRNSSGLLHNWDAAIEQIPAQFGRYEIHRELGRGGYGVVLLARDAQLARDVALKVPRSDVLIAADLRARFVQEARTAAGLDHPNVVQVHEAGEVGPVCYIAYAYCPGITLAQWLAQRGEPVPYADAATLVAVLADAVEHAHRRGVLHRDLKPANVMIEVIGDHYSTKDSAWDPTEPSLLRHLPLAAFRPRITDFGLARLVDAEQSHTHTGTIVGTPSYMAPEQASGRSRSVGPEADVYALGVILYELLAGRTPFLGETPLDTLQQVMTQDPVSLTRLRPKLPRDLETICLKCLEKEPARRYASAQSLADDLRRFLANEPIHARPVRTWEHAVKWAVRHPAVAGLAAAMMITAGLGVAGVTWQWLKAREQATLAGAERDEAVRARAYAERNFARARELVDRLTQLSNELGSQPRMEKTRRKLLEETLEFYQQFLDEKSTDADIRLETVHACLRAGQIRHLLGDHLQAEAAFRRGIELTGGLLAEDPGQESYRILNARLHSVLGTVLRERGHRVESSQSYTRAVEMFQGLVSDFPESIRHKSELANTLINWCVILPADGSWDEAEAAYRRALALHEELAEMRPNDFVFRRERALTIDDFGAFLWAQGRREQAEERCREALGVRERLVEERPDDILALDGLARSLARIGSMCRQTERFHEAETMIRRAIAIMDQVVATMPDAPGYARALAGHWQNLSAVLGSRGEFIEAAETQGRAIAIWRQLAEGFSEDRSFARATVVAYYIQRGHFTAAGEFAQAIDACRKGIDIDPAHHGLHNELAWLLVTAPDRTLRDPVAALPSAEEAVRLAPDQPDYWNTLGAARYRNADFRGAVDALDRAVEYRAGGNSFDWFFLAMAHWQLGEKDLAQKYMDRAVQWMKQNQSDNAELQLFRSEAVHVLSGSNGQ